MQPLGHKVPRFKVDLRIGEACTLRWADVEVAGSRLRLRRSRLVAMRPFIGEVERFLSAGRTISNMTDVTHRRVLVVWTSLCIVSGLTLGWIWASDEKDYCANPDNWCVVGPVWAFFFALIAAALVWFVGFLVIEAVRTAAWHWAHRRR